MAIKYKYLITELKATIRKQIKAGKNKMPTEAELCKKYHVSRQTVRLALSHLETEGLIVKKRGSGSFITGRLSKSEQNRIALLISEQRQYIYPDIVKDICGTLSENGFLTDIYVTEKRWDREREFLETLLKTPPLGILAEGCKSAFPNPNTDLYQTLAKKGVPIVFFLGNSLSLSQFPSLNEDDQAGSALLTRFLLEHGHTSIACLFQSDELQGAARFQGFLETMHQHRLSVPEEHILWYTSREYQKLLQMQTTDFFSGRLSSLSPACTAVICHNDVIAYYLKRELSYRRSSTAPDLKLCAFGNTYIRSTDVTGITTLFHTPHEFGTTAAWMIQQKIKGLPVNSQEILWQLPAVSPLIADGG